jgi:hypothetical protein
MAFLAPLLLLASAAQGQSVVYDSLPGAGSGGVSQLAETGESVTLAGTDRAVTTFELGVFSQLPSDSFDLQLRFYQNDVSGGSPGTVLFETVLDDVPVSSTPSVVSVTVPEIVVPDSVTWTVLTSDSQDAVYFQSSDGATTGIYNSFWYFTGTWNEFVGDRPVYAARITAIPANAPPDCSQAAANPAVLWPPDHKFAEVSIAGVTDDDGDAVSTTIEGIFQDEPVNALGDGNTAPDGFGVGTDAASVRSERSGTPQLPGDGRVYTIAFTAEDEKGGACAGSVSVCVPHERLNGKGTVEGSACVDQGGFFDSTRVACGLGFEIALVLPPLLWLYRQRGSGPRRAR